jgi:hypothetical protein
VVPVPRRYPLGAVSFLLTRLPVLGPQAALRSGSACLRARRCWCWP